MSKSVVLILSLSVFGSMTCLSQDIKFVYDEAGNRIVREIVSNSIVSEEVEYRVKSVSSLDNNRYKLNIRLYPNPTKGVFYVERSGFNERVDIKLFDTSGRLVSERISTELVEVFDISHLPVGIYILAMSGEDGESVYKMIKE